MSVLFGCDVLLDADDGKAFRDALRGRRVALLAHPASVDAALKPVWLRIPELPEVTFSALFGPQHGFGGEKQDNMVETADSVHPDLHIPVFSLYGETRRLKPEWIDTFDVLLLDLQDVGVRVYTFLTTLGYLLEDLAGRPDKELWVLDRPNPVGRSVEGFTLEPGFESFVGAGPFPMRHGLTLGEFARWYRAFRRLDTNLTVVPMDGWDPGLPWPRDRVWLQPSPNMPSVETARSYPGTVMIEGVTLSEARGTTRPLAMVGDPRVEWRLVRSWLESHVPQLLEGFFLRDVAFEPTFHKHAGRVCGGFELVTADPVRDDRRYRPYRLVAAIFKAVRTIYPDLPLWTDPPYEYEFTTVPIDVITGGTRLRRWVEDSDATYAQFDAALVADEELWLEHACGYYRY